MTVADSEGANDTGVPDTVIAEPPGIRVWVPMIKADRELAVTIKPATVINSGNAAKPPGVSRGIVDVPITMTAADGAKDTIRRVDCET